MQRMLITGSSGYLGTRLVEHFQALGWRVLGVDVRAPRGARPDEFVESDIRSAEWLAPVRDFRPDTVIHAAFAFQPLRDEQRMHDINLGGTRRVLAACVEVRPEKLLVVSSATAFGAWPDNPVPMDESWPRRARTEFCYAADKTEVERMIEQFAAERPEITTSWVRPAIIGGPKLDNYLSRFIFGMPFLVKIDGQDTPLQFVHEQDVCDAIACVLQHGGRGGFNVGPEDWTPVSQVAVESGRRAISLPFWLVSGVHAFAWAIRFPIHESPAGFLYFARYPWVVAARRLRDELGFRCRHSSLDTLRQIIQSRSESRS